jgi:pimeloyl-ACP methyl ester carboxylesterase
MTVATLAADPALGAAFLDVSGVHLEVVAKGSGRPLLLLHGMDGVDAATGLIDALAADFSVLAPSHPGFGASDLPRTFGSVDDIAYLYLDLLEARDLRDVTVVGLSFGGWVAAEMLIKNTSRVARTVLSAPLGVRTGERRRIDVADLFMLPQAEVDRRLGAAAGPPPAELPPEQLSRIIRNREAVSLYGWSPYLYDPKLKQRLHRIDVPALVLWGQDDQLAGLDYGRAYAEAIPGARFETLKGGHRLYADQPQALAKAVAAFAA